MVECFNKKRSRKMQKRNREINKLKTFWQSFQSYFCRMFSVQLCLAAAKTIGTV